MRTLALLAVTVALTGCGSPGAAKTPPTAGSEDPAALSCRADVNHANLHVHEVNALDFAIHDCSSLAMLRSTIAANPGYLDLSMTTVKEFARNRCQDPAFLDVVNALVCRELGLP